MALRPGASWSVDEVVQLYLTESAPDRFLLASTHVWIEVRGARGVFRLSRLDAGDFVFRQAVLAGRSVGDAVEEALETSPGFDPGRALTALFGEKLVTGILPSVKEGES